MYWHTGGTNRGNQPRYSLILFFQRWWVKGFNDSYRYMPPDMRESMSLVERKLWGPRSRGPAQHALPRHEPRADRGPDAG